MQYILLKIILISNVYFGVLFQSAKQTSGDYRIIEITSHKYDYSITALNTASNDTIIIISEKIKSKANGTVISAGSTCRFILGPMIDIEKISAAPPNTFRVRARDKRTLWTNGQDKKLIPFKALNLKGLKLISETDKRVCFYNRNFGMYGWGLYKDIVFSDNEKCLSSHLITNNN